MSGRSATCRSYDQSSAPSGSALAKHQRRAALEAADLGDRGPRVDVAGEPVEQRRLVELERRDPVAELVRGEEEREILEAVERLGPALDAGISLQARIGQDGGVDEVLADPRPPCGAERPLHEVAQHAGSLVERSQVAPRLPETEVAQPRRAGRRRPTTPTRRPRALRQYHAAAAKETSARPPIAAAPTRAAGRSPRDRGESSTSSTRARAGSRRSAQGRAVQLEGVDGQPAIDDIERAARRSRAAAGAGACRRRRASGT